MTKRLRLLLTIVLGTGLASTGLAFINPNFTPVDLIDQSGTILSLAFTGVDDEGLAQAEIREVLKGEFSEKQLRVDLYAGAFQAQGDSVRKQIGAGQKDAMLFVGEFQAEGAGDMDDEETLGFLHIGKRWIVLYLAEETLWDLDKEEARLLGTWSGGTGMLLRAVKASMANPDVDFPVSSERTWDTQLSLGVIAGRVRDARPVDLDGDGKAELFFACDQGDRLFRWDGSAMKDITEDLALASRSAAYAWGDFNADGRTDLASWDGDKLSLHAQGPDGRFEEILTYEDTSLKDRGGVALTTVDSADKRSPLLLAAAGNTPILIKLNADRTVVETPLPQGEAPGPETDEPQGLLCADLDGDARPDVVQLFRTYSFFYKGTGPATFSAPVRIRPGSGDGENDVSLGDYDADGRLDICTVSQDRNGIWQNLGHAEFVNSVDRSGEIHYIAKPGGVCVRTGDLNNDGRQDLFIAYGQSQFPQIFFNRGFRSFGHARMLDLGNLQRLTEAGRGQQAGCLGDFNHDGALDMSLVLPDGTAWLLLRNMETEPDLALLVGLSTAGPGAGPINVTASQFGRSFGARVIRAGQASVLFGMREPGPVTLTWQGPGGEVETREIIVENRPVYVFLDKE